VHNRLGSFGGDMNTQKIQYSSAGEIFESRECKQKPQFEDPIRLGSGIMRYPASSLHLSNSTRALLVFSARGICGWSRAVSTSNLSGIGGNMNAQKTQHSSAREIFKAVSHAPMAHPMTHENWSVIMIGTESASVFTRSVVADPDPDSERLSCCTIFETAKGACYAISSMSLEYVPPFMKRRTLE
jgi:hypothetical protein